MMIFGNTTNITCPLSFKQYNLFYTVQTHEICPFMETVPCVPNNSITYQGSEYAVDIIPQ